ncbi:MAG TPA: MBL fold metallo-hydrolase [Chloroflexota bacterium]|nr:MBL fold metallo-hydrolase [Chloroflexota bacterium]
MLRFRSLASGSSGNAYLLLTDQASILFDAGLRLPTLTKYLSLEGVEISRLDAVLLTHEHRDHSAAVEDLAALGVPVWANEPVLRACGVSGGASAVLPVGAPTRFRDVVVTPFPVSHDASCPVGFFVEADGRSLCIATDLGEPNAQLCEAVEASDLVVLESNHDPDMLRTGRYPPHLRRRVAGPTGHLSNRQAASVLADHVRCDETEVWLAHLSKHNNTQALALKTVCGFLRAVGLGSLGVAVAQRDRPSLTWTGARRPQQLSLFG